ncbi:hypothetical protein [Arsukibacterium sp.]|uniref:hypothetical protein n=1 Tax=Arsukibacterium sp. TaxID=1977258 RepID=UPI00299DFFD2|nr:hypothetical protein [Arsukibacterium sp.]MDX1538846.1 hypothetical protein [Arsukibacterium sp.]
MNQPDYNLRNLTAEQHEAAADDTLACYWLHLKAAGKLKRHEINKRLADMPNAQRERMRAALNRNLPKFKGAKNAA